MLTREVTWGEAVVVELFKTNGGLKAAVDAISYEMGKTIGTRNTFAKLLRATDPTELGERDQWRAWLLLTALGHDPEEWSISDSVVPVSVDRQLLKERLRALVRPKGFEPLTSCSEVKESFTSNDVIPMRPAAHPEPLRPAA